MTAELIYPPYDTVLGEGPVWDHRIDTLFWIDITRGRVHAYNPETKFNRTFEIGQYVGAVVPRTRKGLVMALHHGFATLDLITGKVKFILDPEEDKPNNRFNDGKCDPAGRFWAGTTEISHKNITGSLYCLNEKHQYRRCLANVHISNGLCWSGDHTKMYFIDTPTCRVQSYDFDVETGKISNPGVVAVFDPSDGLPDGICIDENDNLWIAFWDGKSVRCYDSKTGKLLERIELNALKATSCAFGGENLDTLYITSAATKGLEGDDGGGLFMVKPGVNGRKADFFRG